MLLIRLSINAASMRCKKSELFRDNAMKVLKFVQISDIA